jgi:DNA-binding NarL/FixJ family response regulator
MIGPAFHGADAMKTVLVVDDHDIVRVGLERLVAGDPALQLIGSANTLSDALDKIARFQPDLVITDMALVDSKGLDTVRAVVQAQAGRAVLVVSMHDENVYAEQALAIGASGYLMKESAHSLVPDAAATVLAGGTWVSPEMREALLRRVRRVDGPGHEALTPRELAVLERLGKGWTTKQIASHMQLSVRTVDIYRSNLKRKLRLRTGAELIAYSASKS